VPININRGDIYQKEIDFFISTSYGPGRYDQDYEEHGMDYPVAYVRWTENRNMSEYLRLLAEKRVQVDALIEATYPLAEAGEAYTRLRAAEQKPLMVLLDYPNKSDELVPRTRIDNPKPVSYAGKDGRIRLALIGAGGFAKGMHLPNIQSLNDAYRLQAVVSRSGHNAQAVARQYEAAYATTDVEEVLADSDVDAVLIATRHHLHADLTLRALRAGKHVLVEKPLAMNEQELAQIESFFAESEQAPVLLTGFNRRFSPHMRRILELAARRNGPFMANYRMNAGHIPSDHWVHGPEGGGRNIGEACHIYDLFTAMAGCAVTKVEAASIQPASGHFRRDDNFVATLSFDDGSLATLTYSALGHKDHPKERLEFYCDGVVAELDDYRQTRFSGLSERGTQTATQNKGQKEELSAFAAAVLGKSDWPIPLWQQLQAMRVAFEVQYKLDSRGREI
jgi:predicted dehydrogenase